MIRRIDMTSSRAFSGLLTAAYVVYAFSHFTFVGAVKFTVALLLPLLCIWFSDAMGAFTGWIPSTGITSPSPPRIVCFLGWVVLLVPLMLWIVYLVSTTAS